MSAGTGAVGAAGSILAEGPFALEREPHSRGDHGEAPDRRIASFRADGSNWLERKLEPPRANYESRWRPARGKHPISRNLRIDLALFHG